MNRKKEAGIFFAEGLYGELEEGALVQCVHCQRTWEKRKGSGRILSGCERCWGFTCDNPVCLTTCVHFERRIENLEAGRPELTPMPTMVLIPSSIEKVA